MAYLVDASVAIKWLVVEKDADQAVRLLNCNEQLLAPRWILTEIANVLWKKCRQNVITPGIASERLDLVSRFFARLVDSQNMSGILKLSIALDHPVYDCIYIQAALDHGATLITADQGLLAKAISLPHLNACGLSEWRP